MLYPLGTLVAVSRLQGNAIHSQDITHTALHPDCPQHGRFQLRLR